MDIIKFVLAPLCAIFIAKGALWLHNVNEVRGALATLVPNWVRSFIIRPSKRVLVSASVVLFLVWTLVVTARYFGDLSGTPYLRAAEAIKRLTTSEDLLITSDGSNPITLYLSERKGWRFPPSMIENGARKTGWSVSAFEELVNSGATYFVVITSRSRLGEKREFRAYLDRYHEKLLDPGDFTIYRLNRVINKLAPVSNQITDK